MSDREGRGGEPGAPPLIGVVLVVVMLSLAAYLAIEVGTIGRRYQREAEAKSVCILAEEQGRYLTCKGQE